VIRPAKPLHESVSIGDKLMPRITIVHADHRYKVLKDGEQIRVPMSTGKMLPVEFETREAAEGYVRVYKIMTRGRRRSRA
jgi:hypothetical protein